MDHFLTRDGELWAEDVPLSEIAAAVVAVTANVAAVAATTKAARS